MNFQFIIDVNVDDVCLHCQCLQVYAHTGAVIDGKIYIACGRRGMAYLKETYCYDPSGNHWSVCAEGPVERAWHGMAALKGRAYVIGGSNDGCGYRRDVLKVLNFWNSCPAYVQFTMTV